MEFLVRTGREGTIENFKNRIIRSGSFYVGGQERSAEEVIERVSKILTNERQLRIQSVLEERTFDVATVGENLYDIGNISALMRSAESFGFLPFHILERSGAKYKKSDRISKGSEKWLDIYKHQDVCACVSGLKKNGYQVYATSLNTQTRLQDIDFSKPTAIVFGNEKDGISEEMAQLADGLFRIPMYGFAQSFNISVAGAICFSHIHRERTQKLGRSGNLTPDEKKNLMANYYLRSCDNPF